MQSNATALTSTPVPSSQHKGRAVRRTPERETAGHGDASPRGARRTGGLGGLGSPPSSDFGPESPMNPPVGTLLSAADRAAALLNAGDVVVGPEKLNVVRAFGFWARRPPVTDSVDQGSLEFRPRRKLLAHRPASRVVDSLRQMGRGRRSPRERPAQLACGVLAGPLFVGTFIAIGARRPGYNWRSDPVSSLAIGRRAWLQRANFVLAGLLYSCAARELGRHSRRRVGSPFGPGAGCRSRRRPDRLRNLHHRSREQLPAFHAR